MFPLKDQTKPGDGRVDFHEANQQLADVKRAALLFFRSKPHDGNDVDQFIAREWHKRCGVPFNKTEWSQRTGTICRDINDKGMLKPNRLDPLPDADTTSLADPDSSARLGVYGKMNRGHSVIPAIMASSKRVPGPTVDGR